MPTDITGVLSLIGTFLLMIAVFVGTYFASRFVAGQYKPTSISGKNEIKIIEKRLIGKEQAILIVRVGEKVFLLGVTPHRIEKIDELDGFDITPEAETLPSSPSFQSVLKNVFKKSKSD